MHRGLRTETKVRACASGLAGDGRVFSIGKVGYILGPRSETKAGLYVGFLTSEGFNI